MINTQVYVEDIGKKKRLKDRRKIMKTLNEILTVSEICERWGINDVTLRERCIRNYSLKEGVDWRKSGNMFLIRRSSIVRIFGEEK